LKTSGCGGSRRDISSLIEACFEPVHRLLATCCQPVLERNELLAHSIKPRKRRKEIARAFILTLDFEFFVQITGELPGEWFAADAPTAN
jgi:hypothetical protein